MKFRDECRKKYVEWLESSLDQVLLAGCREWTGRQLLESYRENTKDGRFHACVLFVALRMRQKMEKGLTSLDYTLTLRSNK